MKDVETFKSALLLHKIELKDKFKVKTIGVFGSYVRGEQNRSSDVDILVEFEEPVGLFEFMKLENYLSVFARSQSRLSIQKSTQTSHRRTHTAGSYHDLKSNIIFQH